MNIWALDINCDTVEESLAVRKRLDGLDIKWATGEMPSKWDPGTLSMPLTISRGMQLYCGGGGELILSAAEFLAKPVNFVLSLKERRI